MSHESPALMEAREAGLRYIASIEAEAQQALFQKVVHLAKLKAVHELLNEIIPDGVVDQEGLNMIRTKLLGWLLVLSVQCRRGPVKKAPRAKRPKPRRR